MLLLIFETKYMQTNNYKDFETYFSIFPQSTQQILQEIRHNIKQLIPNAEEAIKYGIPTFRLHNKNIVHFAGYKNHIGFYPGSKAIIDFKEKLKNYNTSKGTIQFAIDKPIPHKLIKEIVLHCLKNSTIK